jgi:hypothetical protein
MPTYVMNRDIVIQQWGQTIANGAGHDKQVMESIKEQLEASEMPGITCRQTDVSYGGIFSKKREFLLVTHNSLKEYHLFIGARDVGAHLQVTWFMTVVPGFLKRAYSKRVFGNPQALSTQLSIFDQQDLSVWLGVADGYVKQAMRDVLQNLNVDMSGLNSSSKGFLQLW